MFDQFEKLFSEIKFDFSYFLWEIFFVYFFLSCLIDSVIVEFHFGKSNWKKLNVFLFLLTWKCKFFFFLIRKKIIRENLFIQNFPLEFQWYNHTHRWQRPTTNTEFVSIHLDSRFIWIFFFFFVLLIDLKKIFFFAW